MSGLEILIITEAWTNEVVEGGRKGLIERFSVGNIGHIKMTLNEINSLIYFTLYLGTFLISRDTAAWTDIELMV